MAKIPPSYGARVQVRILLDVPLTLGIGVTTSTTVFEAVRNSLILLSPSIFSIDIISKGG